MRDEKQSREAAMKQQKRRWCETNKCTHILYVPHNHSKSLKSGPRRGHGQHDTFRHKPDRHPVYKEARVKKRVSGQRGLEVHTQIKKAQKKHCGVNQSYMLPIHY